MRDRNHYFNLKVQNYLRKGGFKAQFSSVLSGKVYTLVTEKRDELAQPFLTEALVVYNPEEVGTILKPSAIAVWDDDKSKQAILSDFENLAEKEKVR